MKKPLLIATIAPVFALQIAATQAGQVSIDNASDLSVYETVIRFQIRSWQLAAQTYCIQISGRDGDPTLLAHLAPLPVKPASACRKSKDKSPMMTIVDAKTKKPAVIFNLGEIRQVSKSEVQVEGGYFCASQCMAEGVYNLVRDADSWRVESFKPVVMS